MMSIYDQALKVARNTPAIMPEFDAVAAASDSERKRWTDEDSDVRIRARRWLMFAIGVWLAYPLLEAFVPDPSAGVGNGSLWMYACVVSPMVPILLWALRLSRARGFRANVLTRAIAASNLVFALLSGFIPSNGTCVFAILLAVGTGRCLQLLGERGLDGSEDRDPSFEPVRFRGVLILAIVMACADAVTLLWATGMSGAGLLWAHFVEGGEAWPPLSYLDYVGLTAAAAALMAVNVWGLVRLRTWALFSNMLANVAIAALALGNELAIGWYFAIALATTAGIQLLLPLPILAAALGIGGARRYAWVGPALLRVVVPAAVLVTIVVGVMHIGSSVLGLH